MGIKDYYQAGLHGGSRPERGAPADSTVRARLTAREHAALVESAAALELDVSAYLRRAIAALPESLRAIELLSEACASRALTSEECEIFRGLAPAEWHRLGGKELARAPADRATRPDTLTEQGVLDLAELQGYVVMPADPAAAAVLGQVIVHLVREGKLRRVATHASRRLSNADLERGAPNAAVGVARARPSAALAAGRGLTPSATAMLVALDGKREVEIEEAERLAALNELDADSAANELVARGYADVWCLSGSDEIASIELTDAGRRAARARAKAEKR